MKIWKLIVKFFRSILLHQKNGKVEKFISGYTYKYVEDLPQIIESNIVYIVGENDFYWMLGFECPCGCHSTINLNLLDDTFPSWKYTIFNNNLITLRPSIRRVNGCKSHFFIKKSRLVWV
ncbi:MAG: DUF6527 family protein [Lutibacter sp.]